MSYIGNEPLSVAFPKTKEEANIFFEYKDGVLYTKPKPIGSISQNGYYESKFAGVAFKVHRMIFLMHHGWLPEIVDHIDGNPLNNRIENLRAATHAQNKYNQKIYTSNKSGVKGVCWDKSCDRWKAQISYNRKKRHLGYYKDFHEAAEVVDLARQLVHKEFARA